MTPLERAARALYQSAPHDFDPNQMGEDETWPDLVDQVRAVLRAIREPGKDWVDRAMAIGDANSTIIAWGDYPEFWQAMIDAALEEG